MEILKRSTPLAALVMLAMAGTAAQAAPVATGPALSGDGDGIRTFWELSIIPPHSVADAILALGGESPNASFVAPTIDFRDFSGGATGVDNASDQPDPFTHIENGAATDDPTFAVRYNGFLNVAVGGEYSFQLHTDDGFRFLLGGEQVAIFDGDRGPDSSFVTLSLDAGLYSLELIGWEQGGQFVNELSWLRPGESNYAVIGTTTGGKALFTSAAAPVPVPATLPLLGSALAGLGLLRRRRTEAR